jgi:membrane-bound serine protease (ClpP class)
MVAVDWLSNSWMVVVLLIATAVLLMMEILTPSFGVLAAMSILAAGGAVYFAFQIGYFVGLLVLLGILVAAPFYLWFGVKLLPNSPIGRRLFLGAAPDAHNDATPDADELAELIGKQGQAETVLRPSGVVRIDDRRINAAAERGMIQKGQAVTVIRTTGTEVIVRELDNAGSTGET